MEHDGRDEPDQHVARWRAARGTGARTKPASANAARWATAWTRRRAVVIPEALHAAPLNVIAVTHFVLCTPGSAGTMTRAGKPWSSDRSAPLTFSASSARSLRELGARQRHLPERAAPLQRLDEQLARPGGAGQLREARERHAGPALRGRPPLDAGDRQRLRALLHGEQLGAGQPQLAVAGAQDEAVALARHLGPDARPLGGLVDLEAVGPRSRVAAARGEQREPAQRAADRLADVGEQEQRRARADEADQPAPGDRRRRGVARHEAVGIGRLGPRGGEVLAQRPQEPALAVGADHHRQLDHDVDDHRGDEDDRAVVVGGDEAEVERVVVLRVDDAGGELEHGARDQQRDRAAARPPGPRDATGGHANSRGITDHSFASSSGTVTRPTLTCRPWVSP